MANKVKKQDAFEKCREEVDELLDLIVRYKVYGGFYDKEKDWVSIEDLCDNVRKAIPSEQYIEIWKERLKNG